MANQMHEAKVIQHQIPVARDAAFNEAKKHATFNTETARWEISNEQKLITYGRLWMILLATWDEINGQTDPRGADFEEILTIAYNANALEVLEAMFG